MSSQTTLKPRLGRFGSAQTEPGPYLLTALARALALTFLSLMKLHDHTSHHDDGHDNNEEAATTTAADEAGVEAADDEGTWLINAIQAHGHGSGSADIVRTRAVELQWHQLNCMISDKKRNKV